jgi:hypothetical protein
LFLLHFLHIIDNYQAFNGIHNHLNAFMHAEDKLYAHEHFAGEIPVVGHPSLCLSAFSALVLQP